MTKQCVQEKRSGQPPRLRPQAKLFAGFDEDSNFGDRHANENEEKGDGHACSLWVKPYLTRVLEDPKTPGSRELNYLS